MLDQGWDTHPEVHGRVFLLLWLLVVGDVVHGEHGGCGGKFFLLSGFFGKLLFPAAPEMASLRIGSESDSWGDVERG